MELRAAALRRDDARSPAGEFDIVSTELEERPRLPSADRRGLGSAGGPNRLRRCLPLAMPDRPDAALISVSIAPDRALARARSANGAWPIYATSGTRTHLREAGIEAFDVGELTGYPSLFDGR